MPLRIFEFRCSECDAITDELVSPDIHEVSCAACGGSAKRIISAVRIDWQAFVHGPNASEPAISKWDKMRKQKLDIENRKIERNGDPY